MLSAAHVEVQKIQMKKKYRHTHTIIINGIRRKNKIQTHTHRITISVSREI